VKSNVLVLAKLRKFVSNDSGLTKLRLFFNVPITGYLYTFSKNDVSLKALL